jgi:hypothetical protein
MIHQHQRLAVMHRGIALAVAFQACLINQPASCQFHLAGPGRVMRQGREALQQGIGLSCRLPGS